MRVKNTVLPQANIYSSKILFDKLEDRNQKRIAQIVKRKNALLSKNKNFNRITKDKSSEQMTTPSTQELSLLNNISNISKSSIKEENLYNKIIISSKPRTMERFLSSYKRRNKNKDSSDISRNFNIQEDDLYEKEVNISNLNDNDNFAESITEKQKIKNNNKIILLRDKQNKNSNNIKKVIDSDKNTKEKNNICQRNKYAIEFLSSNLDSFVEFKNKLVTKAKYNKNYFTLSYSQALFLDYNNLSNKKSIKDKNYNYEVNDIIKEENESFSPKIDNKLSIGQSAIISCAKKKSNKNSIRLNDSKMPNKSFCKTVEYKNSLKGKSLNKKVLINNCKLKIPKTKLSMEIKNKKNANDNKEFKKVLKNGRQKSINNALSPKFLKLRLFLGEKKENNKNSDKEKSKKIKKRLKLILN
jgi:hypothetical protein